MIVVKCPECGVETSLPESYDEELLGGELNCTEFTDANGKKYYDWIPAIRLEVG